MFSRRPIAALLVFATWACAADEFVVRAHDADVSDAGTSAARDASIIILDSGPARGDVDAGTKADAGSVAPGTLLVSNDPYYLPRAPIVAADGTATFVLTATSSGPSPLLSMRPNGEVYWGARYVLPEPSAPDLSPVIGLGPEGEIAMASAAGDRIVVAVLRADGQVKAAHRLEHWGMEPEDGTPRYPVAVATSTTHLHVSALGYANRPVLVTLDTSGALRWHRRAPIRYAGLHRLVAHSDGGGLLLVHSTEYSRTRTRDIITGEETGALGPILMRFSADGTLLWVRRIEVPESPLQRLTELQLIGRRWVLAGTFYDPEIAWTPRPWVVELDDDGALLRAHALLARAFLALVVADPASRAHLVLFGLSDGVQAMSLGAGSTNRGFGMGLPVNPVSYNFAGRFGTPIWYGGNRPPVLDQPASFVIARRPLVPTWDVPCLASSVSSGPPPVVPLEVEIFPPFTRFDPHRLYRGATPTPLNRIEQVPELTPACLD